MISENIEIKKRKPVSPILIAVCLSLTRDPGEELGIDFLQKRIPEFVTPHVL